MEFKATGVGLQATLAQVLIESDWNLKYSAYRLFRISIIVLIESDWNLKTIGHTSLLADSSVLIESDWNLKKYNSFRTIDIDDAY